jgi:hypothetical protein
MVSYRESADEASNLRIENERLRAENAVLEKQIADSKRAFPEPKSATYWRHAARHWEDAEDAAETKYDMHRARALRMEAIACAEESIEAERDA